MRPFLLAALLGLMGCAFNPDLSRFPPCGEGDRCPEGSQCLHEAQRCVPDCGESCPPEDAGADAGPHDAGFDAGPDDAGFDAGPDDAGFDGGPDDGGTDGGPPALALATEGLPPAIETRPWSHRFGPSGGVPPYNFSIDGGPSGFSLDVGGTLSTAGAPGPGSWGFSIAVQDDDLPRARVSADFTLEVRPLLRVASNGAQIEGRQGQAYAQQLWATGGAPPYTWALDGGALPTGLSLSGQGLVQGSPGSVGTQSFTVVVSDAASPPQSSSRVLSLEVRSLDTLLAIATRSAADGRVGTAYTQQLKAYGGTQPYAWTLSSGALPPGVSLVDTGTVGRLGGAPTMSGTFNFVVRCDDSLTNRTQPLSITVY